jgi:PhzF family phenazine biosynthesis protein
MNVQMQIVNAFSHNNCGGNPAGVVLNADKYTSANKQEIASKAGLSEVAFVSQSKKADFKLDFFTPVRQIPHCGHATIATFSYLKQQGLIFPDHSSKETIDGTREIRFEGTQAFMEQAAPRFYEITEEDKTSILRSHGLSRELVTDFSIGNTGNSFLLIGLSSISLLKDITPDMKLICELSEKYALIGFYFYVVNPGDNFHAATRMFAPYYGIDEEAGTGMAAGPLAALLYSKGLTDKLQIRIEQGRYMVEPSPSKITVNLVEEQSQINKLYVGGNAHLQSQQTIQI